MGTGPKRRPRSDRRLQSLSELAELTASSLDKDELLKRFMRWAGRGVPELDGLAVYLHDPVEGRLVPAAWHGVHSKPFRKVRLKPGEGISGLAFQNCMRFAIENPEDPQAVHLFGEGLSPENALHLQEAQGCILPRGIVSFPLQPRGVFGELPLGVLSAWSHEGPIAPRALEMLELVLPPLIQALLRIANSAATRAPLPVH